MKPAPDLDEFQRRSRAERLNAVRTDIEGVLAEMTAEYVAEWKKAKTIEAREDAHRYVSLIEKFKLSLNAVALSGELASQAIALKDKRWKIPGLRAG